MYQIVLQDVSPRAQTSLVLRPKYASAHRSKGVTKAIRVFSVTARALYCRSMLSGPRTDQYFRY